MAQQLKQQVVDPNVNPPPTEQELLEYRVTMERLTSTFHENVQVHDQGAYAKLIHDLKVTVSKFHKDLVEADEWKVMQSIRRCDGQHFKQGFVVKVRSTTSREQHPEFTAEKYNKGSPHRHLQATPPGSRCIEEDGRHPLQLSPHQN